MRETISLTSEELRRGRILAHLIEGDLSIEEAADGLVRRLAFIVGDAEEVKDLAQSADLKALEAWPRFDGSDPRGWLYTIGINLAISHLRRRRPWRRRTMVADSTWALRVDPDLWQAVGELDAPQRAALLLRDGPLVRPQPTAPDSWPIGPRGRHSPIACCDPRAWLNRPPSQLRGRLGGLVAFAPGTRFMLYPVLYMPSTRTQIYLTADQRRQLDARGRRSGAPLAGMIREAVDAYLAGDRTDAEAALAETFGTLPGLELPSRDEWDERGADPAR